MEILYNNVNPNKIQDELIANGIFPLVVKNDLEEGNYIAENTWITFVDDTDMTAVQAVIDAHDSTPLPIPPTENEILKQKVAQLEQIIDTMLTGGTI